MFVHARVVTVTETFINSAVFTTAKESICGGKMDPITIPHGPVFDGAYVPYFYQSGRFLAYGTPGRRGRDMDASAPYARYDFTPDLTQKAHWPRHQTVEDVILRGYFAIPQSEPELALISDRQETSRLGLSDIISQIRSRYEIYEQNMYQIELGKCYTISSQMAVEADRGGVAMNSREAYSLNKCIGEFYEQQRKERVALWQDVSRLRQSLPEQAQGYLSQYRKLSILNESEGDDL